QKQEIIIKSDAPIASADQIMNKRIIALKELTTDFVNDDSIDLHFDEQDNVYTVRASQEKPKLVETEKLIKKESVLTDKMEEVEKIQEVRPKEIKVKEAKLFQKHQPTPPQADQFISSKLLLQKD